MPVWAGAWVPPAGQSQVIATASIANSSDIGSQPAIELYSEQGLGNGLALVIVAGIQAIDDHAAGEERLTAIRYDLPVSNGWALSGQVGFVEGPRRDGTGDFTALEQSLCIRPWLEQWHLV